MRGAKCESPNDKIYSSFDTLKSQSVNSKGYKMLKTYNIVGLAICMACIAIVLGITLGLNRDLYAVSGIVLGVMVYAILKSHQIRRQTRSKERESFLDWQTRLLDWLERNPDSPITQSVESLRLYERGILICRHHRDRFEEKSEEWNFWEREAQKYFRAIKNDLSGRDVISFSRI